MVKIKEFSEEEAETTDDETTEEEDNDDDPPELPDPPGPLLAPIMFSAPEPSAPEEPAAGPSAESPASGALSPMLRVALSKQYVWNLLRQYGHSIELKRSLQEAHGPIISELQQLPGPPNRKVDPPFACNIPASDTPDRNMEDNSSTESAATVTASTAKILVTESSSQTTEEVGDKDEDNNTESDESAKEKSNGVGEKVQLATTAAGAKAGLLSSPDLSECDLSDVSDSLVPPDSDSLPAELNQEYTAPCGLKECPWAKDVDQDSGMDDAEPELNESAAAKEPSEASDEGEAAALPAFAVVKDCWEEWVEDDRLFTLPSDAPVASTSSAVSARVPSPASPTSERHQTNLENRQPVRLFEARPVTRFIFVPTEKIGRIVGKGGRRVREIEKATGAKIKVEHKKSAKPVTQITLTGSEEEISKADQEICLIIRNFKPPKSGEPTTASVSSIEELELKRLLLRIKNQMTDSEKRCRKPTD